MNTLMHICCAPCANRPIARLREEGVSVTGFWFNPNIHPYTEYQARKRTLEEYAREIGMKLAIGGAYDLRPFITAVAGDGEGSKEELDAIAEGYAPFGVTYDAGVDQWHFNGEKVCFFRDVLTSNGKSLTGGGVRGAMRILSSAEGTVRIETIRDFTRPDFQGYGTLMDIQIIEDA